MEELTLSQIQIDMLKIMIEAYENGTNFQLIMGRAAGKTTVGKIFNEYVRHKKENPSYKVLFTESGVNIMFGTMNFELFDGKGLPEPETPLIYRCEHHTESGPITEAHTEEIRKRLKK